MTLRVFFMFKFVHFKTKYTVARFPRTTATIFVTTHSTD